MKRKLLILSVLVICLAVVSTGTLAYFTAEDTAHNVLTSGEVGIRLVEKMESAGGALIEFPREGITGVMPGADASKIVFVQNIGETEAWIRLRLEISILSADGSELPTVLEIGGKSIPVISPNVKDGWQADAEGYYCYQKPVAPEADTTNFIETVTFAPQAGSEYQNCTVFLNVYAQAVQTSHNPESPEEYGDHAVLQAKGWPAE